MVEMITTAKFDGVVGDIAIVTNQTKIVDFSQPYAASGLLVVAPFKKLNSGAWAFLRHFNLHMWAVTGCCFLFVGIVVWILEHRTNDDSEARLRDNASQFFGQSTAYQRSNKERTSPIYFVGGENTVSTLGRLIPIIWLFIVLIINLSYTASLTSILTVQQLVSPIKGIESLNERNDRIGYQVGSFAESYLRNELNISEPRLVPLGTPEASAKALKEGPKKEALLQLLTNVPM